MAIAGLLGAGMRSAGGSMVKSGAKGLAKGMIGRRNNRNQQQAQPEVQKVEVKVINDSPQAGRKVSGMSSFLSLPAANATPGGGTGINGVEEKLKAIRDLFAQRFAYAKSKSRQDRAEKDRKRKEKREKDLEKVEKTQKSKVKSKNVLPKVGIFDSIRNFLLYTFLAFLENKFNLTAQLAKLLPVIKGVMDFIVDWGGKILNGLATFIEVGYGLVDKTREFIKNIGGEGVLKAFDKMLGVVNTILNALFIYTMAQAALGGGPGFGGGKRGGPKGGSGRPTTRPGQGFRPQVTTSGGRGVNRPDIKNPLRTRPQVTTSGGGTAGRPDIRNPLRTRPQVTTGAGKVVTGEVIEGVGKRAAGEVAEQVTKKTALAAVGKFIQPFTKRIPVFGALVDFVINVALGESAGRAAAKAIGSGLGAWAGGTLGGLAAGAAGSVVPFLGTALGGAVGATFGAVLGGMFGDFLGGWLYDRIAGVEPVQAASKGGVVGDEELKKRVKKELLEKGKIEIPRIEDSDSDLFKFLKRSAKKFNDVPVVGPAMALAVKTMLGKKISILDFNTVAKGIVNFSDLYSVGSIKNTSDFSKYTRAFEVGGTVNNEMQEILDSKVTADNLARFLELKFNSPGMFKEGDREEAPSGTGGGGAGGGDDAGNPNTGGGSKHGVPGPAVSTTPGFDAGQGDKSKRIFLHWTADTHSKSYSNYHTTFLGDGKAVRNIPYGQDGDNHTGGANTNSVGLSIAAMGADAQGRGANNPSKFDVSPYPPTSAQVSAMTLEAARLAVAWGWDESTINKNVMTHGEWERHATSTGKLSGAPQRWDLDMVQSGDGPTSGGDKLRKMIKSYFRKLKQGTTTDSSGKTTVTSTGQTLSQMDLSTAEEMITYTSGGGTGAQFGSPEMRAMLDVLAFAEGTTTNKNGATGPAGYSTWAGYQRHGPPDLTGLTIQQVHDLQTSFMREGKTRVTGSAVVGRYQFKDLLAHYAPQAGLKGSDLFSPENQDKMAIKEMERVGVTTEKLKGGLTQAVLDTLAPIWASMPYSPKGGASYYGGQPSKPFSTLKGEFEKALNLAKQPPIARVPGTPGAPGAGLSDVERGDPSKAAANILKDFPQIRSRANSQQIYASGLGFYLKKSGAGEGGKGDFGNPPGGDMEHPDHGGVVASHRGQGHYKGQALDLGGNSATSSGYRDDQKKLFPYVARFLKKYGLDQEPTVPQILHGPGESFSPRKQGVAGPDGGHADHLHVEFQGGGLIGESVKKYGDMSTKASYERGGSAVLIQPVIIEKQVPSNFMMAPVSALTFSTNTVLNTNNNPVLSRG